jgi:hypothetical protein
MQAVYWSANGIDNSLWSVVHKHLDEFLYDLPWNGLLGLSKERVQSCVKSWMIAKLGGACMEALEALCAEEAELSTHPCAKARWLVYKHRVHKRLQGLPTVLQKTPRIIYKPCVHLYGLHEDRSLVCRPQIRTVVQRKAFTESHLNLLSMHHY